MGAIRVQNPPAVSWRMCEIEIDAAGGDDVNSYPMSCTSLLATIARPFPSSLPPPPRMASLPIMVNCVLSQEKFERIASTRRRQKEQHKRFLAALKDKRVQEEVRRERFAVTLTVVAGV